MTPFAPFTFERRKLAAELLAFETLLGPPTRTLGERQDIIPFFKQHRHLAGLIGLHNSKIGEPSLIKAELGLFGDHACDLAIGDAATAQFCFIEFEDAKAESVFRKPGSKGRPDWSPRLEHGFGQLLDWFGLLDDMRTTARFRAQFGYDLADYTGLLVIGRDGFLNPDQRRRLHWRAMNIAVAGRRVECITFDQLLDWLRARVKLLTP
jgi:hypothetical protein